MSMRLLKLELSGFKSFVDPVKVGFPGGITAVVGPNGCGKSNISDAVSWVLGEQSAKSLRGTRMEDVIFNGAERRKPLGMAEVTMVLAADPSFAAAEEGRIAISRRVFRSGESQYRINGKTVRLKDLKDLLMDTGLGIRAYSVIEQGKIGMILSGKPHERRRLLEEAAGVTRYKNRKRIAELKLEEATGNLLRLDDIVSEVERSLRSLKRQSNAARRYQERQAEYRLLLAEVLAGRWNRLQARLAKVRADLEAATTGESELAAATARGEAELAAGRERLDELATAVASHHERQAALAARIEGRQEFLKQARGRLGELAERAASSRKLADEREEEIAGHGEQLEALGRRHGEMQAELERAEAELGQGEERLAGFGERLAAAEAEVEERRRALLSAVEKVNRGRNRLHQGQIELEKGTYQQRYLEQESDGVAAELAQLADQLAVAQENVATLERRQGDKESELEQLGRALDEIIEQEAAAVERRQTAEAELTEARQRREVLARLSEAHARQRAGLEEALAAAGLDQPRFLSDQLTAAAGWERSLDFYLGALEDAVVLPPGSDPLALLPALDEHGVSAALLTPEAAADAGIADDPEGFPAIDDPAVALSLGRALGLAPELARALPPAFLVDRPEDARRLARRHPGIAFLSRDGIWAAGGLVHLEGGKAVPGVLERERELAELADELPRLEERLAAAVARVEELVEERARRAQRARQLEGELNQLRQELAVASSKRQDLAQRHRRSEEQRDGLSEERQRLEAEVGELTARQQQLGQELAASEQDHSGLGGAVDRAQEAVAAIKGEREQARAEAASRQGNLDLMRERLVTQQREIDRLRREREEGERLVRLWREEAGRLGERRAVLVEEIDGAENELAELLEKRSAAQRETLAAQENLDGHREQLKRQDQELAALRSRHGEARGRVEELRVEQASLAQDVGHLTETFAEQLEAEPPAEPGEVPAQLAEMEADLARHRSALERLGPVNMLAVQEFDEQQERHGFLLEQRRDVVDSVESLRRTIREINQTSSERFKATFEEVNRSFEEIFTRLFRGGEATMRLLDEEDLLESGIEIVARPPGKRLQNIMLLSGGEKALTAIALLFALFRSKPSPFCILDEVDAPLDDANALRFVEELKEMSSDTQFIVITHNKLTMEIAQSLYGVTMQERGVSTVVSVELDDIHPETGAITGEAATA